ncbi:hypothetical protein [Candidatus Pseudothioglobus sp. Uisw_086]|uniref:hypothetical protein n=1 Tax=Candidatus Pseudothioglobus sp. Uisw_086 TaxID=3230998 RepID=UPI003A861E2C
MKKILLIFVLLLPNIALSNIIVKCENIQGYSYYPFSGLVPKSENGWDSNGFTGGFYRLTQDYKGSLDVVFLDDEGQPISTSENIQSSFTFVFNDGKVAAFSVDQNQVSIIVLYMGSIVEKFTFLKDTSRKEELMVDKAKIIPKILDYRSSCSEINKLRLLKLY